MTVTYEHGYRFLSCGWGRIREPRWTYEIPPVEAGELIPVTIGPRAFIHALSARWSPIMGVLYLSL